MTSGCSDDSRDVHTRRQATEQRPSLMYVAVGASETFGIGASDPLREAWPRVFHRTALPRRASFVNLGVPGATVADALIREARRAARLKPDIVTVWLNVNDILSGVRAKTYERDLVKLLKLVSTNQETTLLIANTPPLEWLPSYRACRPNPPPGAPECNLGFTWPRRKVIDRLIGRYNAAIERAAASVEASVVDLHAATLGLLRRGEGADLVSGDGFHPSTEGHKEVAKVFARAYARIRR